MMRAFGAEVCLIDQVAGGMPGQVSGADMQLVKNRAARLVAELGAFFCDQFENPDNAAAHENGTAVELWEQCAAPNSDAIVVFVGTGGAMGGLVRYLRSKAPQLCRCCGAGQFHRWPRPAARMRRIGSRVGDMANPVCP